jgi:hypothetical protein
MTTQEERDEDLAFEQGFNTANAEAADEPTTPQVAEPAPPQQAATATAQAVATPDENTEPEPDPFASLPPAVRDLLATIPAMRAEQEQLRRMANMVPALQSRLDKMNPPAHATDSPSVPAKSRFAKVEALRDELPEIADALDEIANDRHPAPAANQPEPRQQATAQPQASPEEKTLTIARPTWADDLTSSDFQLWLVRQPRDYQAQVQQTSEPGEILAALARYDAAKPRTNPTQQLNQTRTSRMAAAVTTQGDGRRRQTRAADPGDEEEAAFTAAFNKQRGR